MISPNVKQNNQQHVIDFEMSKYHCEFVRIRVVRASFETYTNDEYNAAIVYDRFSSRTVDTPRKGWENDDKSKRDKHITDFLPYKPDGRTPPQVRYETPSVALVFLVFVPRDIRI